MEMVCWLARACRETNPSLPSTHPPNPPNPLSQSFSQSYGSILPTSLTYFILSTRGCTPWRPAAVISTTCRNAIFHLDFQGLSNAIQTRMKLSRSSSSMPFRQLICFHAISCCYQEKISLPGAFANVSKLSCVAACPATCSGILTRFPFGVIETTVSLFSLHLLLRID
jgi:hypothetical protein